MFKDFRQNLRQIDPKPVTREDIERLFKQGKFTVAQKLCKRASLQCSDFQESIEVGAKRVYFSGGVGGLLSFMYNTGVKVQYDLTTLLKSMFGANDYHGFLKQAHRFKLHVGIEKEIEIAIEKLIEKRQIHDAEGWRRKFKALQDNDKPV
jgi:hypothetical protein